MKRNSTLFLMMVLVCICWFGIFKFSGLATLYLEEPMEYAGRTIIAEKISNDMAVISVDGEQDLFKIGETKTINGVKVHLSDITYFPEKEDRKVELNLESTTVCSDEKCELGEDSSNCCVDCGCSEGYNCENNECIYRPADQCTVDTDCDDSNASTEDFCFGSPKICHYQNILCNTNEDCNDNDPCTSDRCTFNDCIHEPMEDCESEEVPVSQPNKESFFSKFIKKIVNLFK